VIWWLWPHFKRIWTAFGAITVGLAVNYLYGLWGKQLVLDLRRLADFLYSYWYWTGGALAFFAIVSVFAEHASTTRNAAFYRRGARPRRRQDATTTGVQHRDLDDDRRARGRAQATP
jgi:hypothetical protein